MSLETNLSELRSYLLPADLKTGQAMDISQLLVIAEGRRAIAACNAAIPSSDRNGEAAIFAAQMEELIDAANSASAEDAGKFIEILERRLECKVTSDALKAEILQLRAANSRSEGAVNEKAKEVEALRAELHRIESSFTQEQRDFLASARAEIEITKRNLVKAYSEERLMYGFAASRGLVPSMSASLTDPAAYSRAISDFLDHSDSIAK